jgi:hypothetical protein
VAAESEPKRCSFEHRRQGTWSMREGRELRAEVEPPPTKPCVGGGSYVNTTPGEGASRMFTSRGLHGEVGTASSTV